MVVTILRSPYDHPYYHLSLEEFFLKQEPFKGPIILFYINKPSVIMGRNQNPWRESNIAIMQSDHVILGRRLTGGGTVYHDYGNINYSVIYQQRQFSEDAIFQWLLRGFEQLGLSIQVGQRKELLLNGLKISGTAFGRYQNKVIHHGTLLVSADLDAMSRYLEVNNQIVFSKSVKSVPSEVVNLQSRDRLLDHERILNAMEGAIQEPTVTLSNHSLEQIVCSSEYLKLLDKHQSWQWIFGETPSFQLVNPLDEEDYIEVLKGKVINGSNVIKRAVTQAYPAIRTDYENIKEVTHADR
jgi:lipoate-protein ligase A